MMASGLMVALVVGFILIGVIVAQTTLAIFHDRAVTAEAPIRTLEKLKGDIDQMESALNVKRATKEELDEEIAKRHERLADVADIQLQCETLSRQRDELNAEWNQLEARRNEVREVRAEIENAINEKLSIDSELAFSRAELEELKARYTEASQLSNQLDGLRQEHESLLSDLAALRKEAVSLTDMQEKVSLLDAQRQELAQSVTQLEGRQALIEIELAASEERISSARNTEQSLQSKHLDLSAKIAFSEESLRQSLAEKDRFDDQIAEARAKVAQLEDRLQQGSDGGQAQASEENSLKELSVLPPVLANMASWPERQSENEADALKRVRDRMKAVGLDYHPRVINAFHTAMKVNETTQMAVLAGISGTGKSQLPRQYASAMGIGFLQVPVQPRWDSPQDLMGFYNYIEKKFRPTDMARALYQLDAVNRQDTEFKDRMMMILLDEMNLARVEYYFSDFLSRLESRPRYEDVEKSVLRKDAEIELEIPMPNGGDAPRIFPGYNLLFAGTMNEDESTQSLSDKVVDRANVLRFAAPKTIHTGKIAKSLSDDQEALSKETWRRWYHPADIVEQESQVTSGLDKMVKLMKDFNHPIGHRLGRAIKTYVANYPEAASNHDYRLALADQVEMRLLPKIRGCDIENYSSVFDEMCDFVAINLNDDVLAKAIDNSVTAAGEGNGLFVWKGVTR